eukprot:CAMPEP_0194692670 /NCGR_PEP_ID=MMETSP0295-20121207/19956_1 /TAXON_ID=39354 /ORGANISM="Heterosigma akashiwo, Strain CCMP2393" /LENGTH=91 /DNA_ID=CAMNT_0039583169 /DNA_START=163 /DNA_END=434 /DNA_ORIENTATION=+
MAQLCVCFFIVLSYDSVQLSIVFIFFIAVILVAGVATTTFTTIIMVVVIIIVTAMGQVPLVLPSIFKISLHNQPLLLEKPLVAERLPLAPR